jgi:hypothetical protein
MRWAAIAVSALAIPGATREGAAGPVGDFLEVAAQFLGPVTYVGRCPALAR